MNDENNYPGKSVTFYELSGLGTTGAYNEQGISDFAEWVSGNINIVVPPANNAPECNALNPNRETVTGWH
jgi:hypothetical protein